MAIETIFCPFCGSPAWKCISSALYLEYYIECIECGAKGPIKENSAEALEKWASVSEKVCHPEIREGGKF